MEWISIKERLPKDDETVLVINSEIDKLLPMVCYFCEETEHFFALYHTDSFSIVVTHWMKVPEFKDDNN